MIYKKRTQKEKFQAQLDCQKLIKSIKMRQGKTIPFFFHPSFTLLFTGFCLRDKMFVTENDYGRNRKI